MPQPPHLLPVDYVPLFAKQPLGSGDITKHFRSSVLIAGKVLPPIPQLRSEQQDVCFR